MLDYSVAVLWTAWDGASAPRIRSRRHEAAAELPVELVPESAASARLRRNFRVAASLAVIGVLAVSIVSAPWSPLFSEREDTTPLATSVEASPTERAVAAWAPLIRDSAPTLMTAPVHNGSPAEAAQATAEAAGENDTQEAPLPTPPSSEVDAAAAVETPAATEPPAEETPVPTPTPEPTPLPTPEPPPPAPAAAPVQRQLTTAEMTAAAIQAGWPEDLIPDLLSVAWCESRFRPDAQNFNALGLMQIMSSWFTWLGIDVSMASDPVTNLRVAQYIYAHDLEAGYEPWASWACKPAGLPADLP